MKEVAKATGRKLNPSDLKISIDNLIDPLQRGADIALNLNQAGDIGHMVALNKVVSRTIVKVSGKTANKLLFYVMNPSVGQYVRISNKALSNYSNIFTFW